ncbi:TPA: hypothetical protein MYQ19_004065 [Klebsiella oxytoca]|nr:hypothetical protein [Klebsiella oxytoca]HCB1759679.1 hypothetical protein [Klebsiella oxytoca]HCB1840761.1 hypothetical protein [Klebsiella oxytoca]HCB1894779.1 hypothetical protein [Klebsiella oxytoca]
MKKDQVPVFAVTGWEFHNIKEHDAMVMKLHFAKPPATPDSKQLETPVLSFTSVQLSALISSLQAKLTDLQKTEGGLH